MFSRMLEYCLIEFSIKVKQSMNTNGDVFKNVGIFSDWGFNKGKAKYEH